MHAVLESPGTRVAPLLQALPMVRDSLVARAVAASSHRLDCIPYPHGMQKTTNALRHVHATYKVAVDKHHIALLQDAHAAANSLTILEKPEQYERFKRAEDIELTLAAKKTMPKDGSLPPRPHAVTVVWHAEVTTLNTIQLLDAAQFLARESDVSGHRAAHTSRMSFLAGPTGRRYVQSVRGLIAPNEWRAFVDSKAVACVVLTWNADDERKHALIPISFEETSADYALQLRLSIGKRWDVGKYYPSCRLSRLYPETHNAQNAHVVGVQECANDFFATMRLPSDVRLSAHARNSPQYSGYLEFSHVFLRITPRPREGERASPRLPQNDPVTDPNVVHGLLLCQKGWRDETIDTIRAIQEEELERGLNRFRQTLHLCAHLTFFAACSGEQGFASTVCARPSMHERRPAACTCSRCTRKRTTSDRR